MEPTQSVIRQCARQTEQLFDLYLNLDTENALKDINDRNEGGNHSFGGRQLEEFDGALLPPGCQFQNDPPGAPPPRFNPSQPQRNLVQPFNNSQRNQPCPSPSRPETLTEEQLKEIASQIREMADEIDAKYREDIGEPIINRVLERGRGLTYQEFEACVNGLIGEGRNLKNFVLVMYLSRRVVLSTWRIGSQVKEYFRMFIPAAFAEQIARNVNLDFRKRFMLKVLENDKSNR